MDNGKLDVATDYSVIALTKWIMQKYSLNQAQAFRKLAATKLYELIMDSETGLCLEPNEYLQDACRLEFEDGTESMLDFIAKA